MLKKKKLIGLFLLIICLFPLSGCKDNIPTYIKKGYTAEVIYDLGEGVFKGSNRDTHSLTIYYKPDSYITDFSSNPTYKFVYEGHELVGWYFSNSFNESEKVDFSTYKTTANSTISIYAKWQATVTLNFDVYYQDVDTNEIKLLESVPWEYDEPFDFEDSKLSYPSDEPYTLIGLYQDKDMTIKVDDDYVLNRDEGTNLPIYTKWIKGDFEIINNEREFINYFGVSNLYINNDLDMTDKKLIYIETLSDKTILGNNHTISNLTVVTTEKKENNLTLGGLCTNFENVVMKDIKFDNVTYNIKNGGFTKILYFAPIAYNIVDSTLENVSINGKIEITDQNTLERIESGDLQLNVVNDSFGFNVDENTKITNCILNVIYERKE